MGNNESRSSRECAYTRASDPMDVLSRNRKLEVPDRLEFTCPGIDIPYHLTNLFLNEEANLKLRDELVAIATLQCI